MRDLIERLEKATEGSRELDDAIAGAVLEYAGSVRLVGMPDSEASIKTFRRHAEGAGSSLRYTTSLDAALMLVPEGWTWSVDGSGGCVVIKADDEGLPDWHAGDERISALSIEALLTAIKGE